CWGRRRGTSRSISRSRWRRWCR
ncbi:MAG: hypothetical protein AVDCRST_MAG18-4605, partial [uncultured Thermomicrobiales bacterium]